MVILHSHQRGEWIRFIIIVAVTNSAYWPNSLLVSDQNSVWEKDLQIFGVSTVLLLELSEFLPIF